MVNNPLTPLLPTRELLVLNEMVDSFKRGMIDYQAKMNMPDRTIEIHKTTPDYCTVKLINFNDNDLMLFGYCFYSQMLNQVSIMADSITN